MTTAASRDLGEAAWTARDLYPIRRSRADLAADVARLREHGMTHREVASVLGISRSYASTLAIDPEGAKQRERRVEYRGVCESCGALTDGSNGPDKAPTRCFRCRPHEERHWTPERIVEAMQEAARLLGRPPCVVDLVACYPTVKAKMTPERLAEAEPLQEALASGALRFPVPAIVAREFGSWSAGRVAAGLPPSEVGGSHTHRRNGNRNGHRPAPPPPPPTDPRPELTSRRPRRDELRSELRRTSERLAASSTPTPTDPEFRRLVETQIGAATARARATLAEQR